MNCFASEDNDREALARVIIWAARLWLGTPFRHQGRTLNGGVDCVGLLTQVNAMVFDSVIDRRNYGRMSRGDELREGLQSFLVEQWWRDSIQSTPGVSDVPILHPADVLLLKFGRRRKRHHVGIATDVGMIHAHQGGRRPGWPGGKVVEIPLDDRLRSSIWGVYRWPALSRGEL